MDIGSQVLFNIGPVPVSNTITTTLLLDIFLVVFAIVLRKKLALIPGKMQGIFEFMHDFVLDLTKGVLSERYINAVFPWVLSFFFIILVSNWMGLLPGIGTIVINISGKEFELFKGVDADLNTTMSLALISFTLVQFFTLKFIGASGWFKHYFHTKPISLIAVFVFVGVLEIFLDPIKFLSLGLRLFGNIFAGETLVNFMSSVPVLALPFLLLEILVGVVQALIFTGLSTAFMGMMLAEEEQH